MILTTSKELALIFSGAPVYIADHGSSVPHSVCIDGHIYQLIDPPELSVSAGPEPRLLTQEVTDSLSVF